MKIFCNFSLRRALYQKNLQRRDEGKFNCLPLKFKRGRVKFPGFERYKYYLFSANQKVGKSKLVDDLFIYYPTELRIKHKVDIHTKVLYFALEENEDLKGTQLDSHFLYNVTNIRNSPKELKSTSCKCPQYILDELDSDEVQEYIKDIEKNITYVSDIRNPTGIYKEIKKWVESLGHYNYTKGKKQDAFGEWVEADVIDKNNKFTLDDPELYPIVIIDNFANLTPEQGFDTRQTIEKMSKYCIELANLGIIMVAVQHQSQSQESLENLKYSQIIPTVNGLGDAKTTARDAWTTIGLFSPYRFQIQNHLGYDITQWKDYIRFLYIISDRDGAVGVIIPLLFRGDVSSFEELPKPEYISALQDILNTLEEEDKHFEEVFQIEKSILETEY